MRAIDVTTSLRNIARTRVFLFIDVIVIKKLFFHFGAAPEAPPTERRPAAVAFIHISRTRLA